MKKKIKIMFVVPDFYPNSTGFANASRNLVESIIRYGSDKFEVFVFTDKPLLNNKELKGLVVYRYNKTFTLENRMTYRYFFNKRYKFFKNIIIKNNIDIIFFETNTFPFFQEKALEDFAKKVYVRIHSTADTEVPVFSLPKNNYEKKRKKCIYTFMQNVNNIVSTSSYYLDFVKHYYMYDNVYSMWNGKSYGLLFNTAGIDSSPVKVVNNHHFLTMGKMSENGLTQKGLLDLIKAVFILFSQKALPSDFKLIIIGNGTQFPVVANLIKELSIDKYVEIIKQATHEEVFAFMKSVRSIILLSRYEGQSMFITESIALGKPLILSDNNGMQDMLLDGVNGLSVKTGDYYDAADKILKMLSFNDIELEEMCKNSSELYSKKYSGKAVYQQFEDLLRFTK